MKAVFITGTDTGVGKTVVCGLLARYLLDRGYRVVTQKWIQTGSVPFAEDVGLHLKLMGKKPQEMASFMGDINPYCFKSATSPHLAAILEKRSIDAARIKSAFSSLSREFDFVLVEGIGGALVPFDGEKLVVDIARELNLPVLIVAQNRLGTINHTLLTIEALSARRMKILGVIFNRSAEGVDEVVLEDNPKIVNRVAGERILGELPWIEEEELLHEAFAPIGDDIFTQLKEGR